MACQDGADRRATRCERSAMALPRANFSRLSLPNALSPNNIVTAVACASEHTQDTRTTQCLSWCKPTKQHCEHTQAPFPSSPALVWSPTATIQSGRRVVQMQGLQSLRQIEVGTRTASMAATAARTGTQPAPAANSVV